MRLIIQPKRNEVSRFCSEYVVERITKWCEDNDNEDDPNSRTFGLCVSGRDVVMSKLLDDLVAAYRAGSISFKKVAVFATDEFVNLEQSHTASQHYYLYHRLFKHVDILRENVHLLNGNCGMSPKDWENECRLFEDAIESVGGLELVVIEPGVDGSIGRNSPGSSLVASTRKKMLNYDTSVQVAEEQFDGDLDQVPKISLTIGLGTLSKAKEVLLLFSGIRKARALAHCTENPINHMWPCSFVQKHQCSMIVCDEPATSELRMKTVTYFKGLQKTAALQSLDSKAHLTAEPSLHRLRRESEIQGENDLTMASSVS